MAGHKAVHCICTSNSDCHKNMVPIRRVRFSWDQGLIVPATTNGLKLSLDANAGCMCASESMLHILLLQGVLYMYRMDRPVMIFAKSRIQSFKSKTFTRVYWCFYTWTVQVPRQAQSFGLSLETVVPVVVMHPHWDVHWSTWAFAALETSLALRKPQAKEEQHERTMKNWSILYNIYLLKLWG